MSEAATAPAPASVRNPVEKRMAQLHDLWWEQTQGTQWRAIVLRTPPESQRMLEAFFTLQMVDSEYATPDLFVRFDAAFETGFAYSRTLREHLLKAFDDNRQQLIQQGVSPDWPALNEAEWDSATGFMETALSFARHLHRHRVSVVLQPSKISEPGCFERWLDVAMRTPMDAQDQGLVRLVLIDDSDTRAWQGFAGRYRDSVHVIDAPIDIMDTAREIAAQSGGGGSSQALFRQMYTDMLALLRRGDAAGVEARGERAMQVAAREGWKDQRAVLDVVIGSAWMQSRDFPKSIGRYRSARESAFAADKAGNPMGRTLVMQSWLAEGSAWVAAGDMKQAALSYEHAAEAAQRVPNSLFAVEGYRSAAQSWKATGNKEEAMRAAMLGVREARAMADADRPNSTVPQLLDDLLHLQDEPRCERIARAASTYERDALVALVEADLAAHRLGPHPQPAAIASIEEKLELAYERVFQRQLREREKLVLGGDEVFRTVIALGRQWLDPTWSGLPHVRHPLDREIGEWREPPEFAVLPDPQPFLEAA